VSLPCCILDAQLPCVLDGQYCAVQQPGATPQQPPGVPGYQPGQCYTSYSTGNYILDIAGNAMLGVACITAEFVNALRPAAPAVAAVMAVAVANVIDSKALGIDFVKLFNEKIGAVLRTLTSSPP